MNRQDIEKKYENTSDEEPAAAKRTDLYDEMITHPAHLIRRSYQIFQAGFDEDMAVTGVTPVQWIILVTVFSYPGIDMTRLAGFAAVDKTSCGRAVSKLVERGFLQVSPIVEDLRQKRLSVTKDGELAIEQTRPGVGRLRDRLLGVLSREEQKNLLEALEVFVRKNNELSRAPQRRYQKRSAKNGGS